MVHDYECIFGNNNLLYEFKNGLRLEFFCNKKLLCIYEFITNTSLSDQFILFLF